MSTALQPAGEYRYSFGAEEFLFIEISEEMSLDANFRAAALARAITAAGLPGIWDICPSNASVLLRFDPERIAPTALEQRVRELAADTADLGGTTLPTRIIEVPVWYDDPFTNDVGSRFRANHQTPDQSDLDYAAAENGFAGRAEFIAAHHSSPWLVTMVGFVAGLPFLYQMVSRDRHLEVPKYVSPRTDTPPLTVGHGGCFTAIYSVRGAGGYQMFGVAATPIYEPEQILPDFQESIVLFRPGDIVVFRPVDAAGYDEIQAQVKLGAFRYRITPFDLDVAAALSDPEGYSTAVMEAAREH